MKHLAYILFTSVFVYYACLSAGRILLRLLKVELYRSEERFLGFVLGASCLSLLVFVLAAFHLAYKGVFLTVGILLIVLGRLAMRGGPTREDLPPLTRMWSVVFWTGYALYAVLYLANGVLPEMSPDGTAYHVGLIAQYYRAHSLLWLTTSLFADLSQGIEMLFLFAFPFGKQTGAAMVHVLFLLALPLGILSYARRFGMPAAGVVGGLLVFMSPIAGIDGVSAYVDVAVAAIVFAVFNLLQIWAEKREKRLLIPIGLLGGFAYGAKYIAFAAVPYALIFIAVQLWKTKREALRAVLVVSGCAAVMMAPWLIRNAVVVANPVSPFGNEYFRNPYIHVSFERTYAAVMSNVNGVTYLQLPWELCVSGTRLLGLLGPVFLLTPLAIGAIRRPQGRQLLIAAAIFAAPPLIALATTRWWLTALPFIAVAMAMVLCRWRPIGLAALALHAVLSWPAVVALYGDGAWRILDLPWRAALRLESDEHYTAAALGDVYEMCGLVNRNVPVGQKILTPGSFPRSWVERDIVVAWESAFGERLSEAMHAAMPESTWRSEYRFPPRRLEKIRVVQNGKSDWDNWSMNELRFYRAGQELPRLGAWRLTAWPNPWDVQLAFDNNRATSWSTWEPYRPGMYVEVDFGAPAEVDQVAVECSCDLRGTRLRLQTGVSGRWQDIESEHSTHEVPQPQGLRREAAAYLKANGIEWLLFSRSDGDARDLVLNRPRWGLTLRAATQNFRLYHID